MRLWIKSPNGQLTEKPKRNMTQSRLSMKALKLKPVCRNKVKLNLFDLLDNYFLLVRMFKNV